MSQLRSAARPGSKSNVPRGGVRQQQVHVDRKSLLLIDWPRVRREKVDDPGSKQLKDASRVSVGYKLETKQGPIEEMPMIPHLPTRLVKCNEWVGMRGVRREH